MAVVLSPPLSPREVSPTCKKATEALGPHQAFVPGLFRCTSYPSRGAGQLASAKPSALLERRARLNPSLKVSAFQASAAATARTSANSSPAATLYDVLEVPRTATENEIKTAYRRLARQHHPDRAPLEEKEASTNKFLQIHSAYAALSDPQSRAKYDLQLSLPSYRSAGLQNRSPKFYTPPSSNYCSPRTPYSSGRGRSWESDQCWC